MAHHGNTPAAWTGVTLLLVGFVVAGIGVMMESWTGFWVGAIIGAVGLLAGVVMSKTGHGATD
jgi:purine-cytosine permease-like protein